MTTTFENRETAAEGRKPREEIVHDQVSGRMRRKAVFNDNLENEIGDEDDDEEDEDNEELDDEENEYSGIRLRSVSDKVSCQLLYS